MKEFFGEELLLGGGVARELYGEVKDLPILDYHCHLSPDKIASDASFSDIGELWLAADHYKWRAMRLNGIDEKYITGDADYRDKFLRYAEVLPALVGNPLYYWTHLELRKIFGIYKPLNAETAVEIYEEANEKLRSLSVRRLLEFFRVEFVATTDDPVDDLHAHGRYGNLLVAPTFRPDRAYWPEKEYKEKLARAAGMAIGTLAEFKEALRRRLDYFCSKGCRMSDHGFDRFPAFYADEEEAERIFSHGDSASREEKQAFFGHMLLWLSGEYKKRGICMQIHFGVKRNVNPAAYALLGGDSGFDVIGSPTDPGELISFLQRTEDKTRPEIVLYTLNDSALPALASIAGAFRGVRMGAAWWFNDTVEGIRKNLLTVAEYASLGENLGMLTDSRSFSGYVRFDFFRRILCDFIAGFVERGEYERAQATKLAKDICYNNVKEFLRL